MLDGTAWRGTADEMDTEACKPIVGSQWQTELESGHGFLQQLLLLMSKSILVQPRWSKINPVCLQCRRDEKYLCYILHTTTEDMHACGEQNFAPQQESKLAPYHCANGAYLPRAVQRACICLFDDHSCANPFTVICS